MTDPMIHDSATEPASAPEAPRADRRVRAAVWASVVYLAFWQVAPRIRDERIGTVVVSTIVSLVLVVFVTALAARSVAPVSDVVDRPSVKRMLLLVTAAALVVVPLRIMFAVRTVAPPWSWAMAVPGLTELAFILLGVAVGALLSLIIRSANMIPPVAVVLAVVDIWTVMLGGPVQQAMEGQTEGARKLAEAMTVQLPAPTSGAAPIAVVGFADFVFIAFFVAAMCRYMGDAVGYGRTVRPLAVVLALYMVVVLATGWSLPALVPMAVTVLALHWRRFRYERSEAMALVYAGALLVVLLAASLWFRSR